MQPDPPSGLDAMVADLRAKLDADEQQAQLAAAESQHPHWLTTDGGSLYSAGDGEWEAEGRWGADLGQAGFHMARHDPARVLALVAAHRRLLDDLLVEQHRACAAEPGGHDSCSCGRDERVVRRIRLLAAAYADRDESGRPA